MESSGRPSKQIFDQSITVFVHLQARHEETRKNAQLQNIITAVRDTVHFFIENLKAKKYHEYDSTQWANDLKLQVHTFLKENPKMASQIEPVLREEGKKLLVEVTKTLGN